MRYPAGIGYVPLRPEAGQYLGKPVCHNGQVILLLVDFPKQEIQILAFDETTEQTSPLAILPLSIAKDCYNLMLEASPFMLTRSANDNKFQILWPERREFLLEDRESFSFLDGDKMYTEIWYEGLSESFARSCCLSYGWQFPGRQLCSYACLCQAAPCGWHPVGK